MDTRSEFPQFYHVEDLYGNVFALVCKESDTSWTVIQKRDVRKSFIVSKVSSEEAVKMVAPGQILGASQHDYEEVLKKEFGFALSSDVLCDKLESEETKNVTAEKSVLAAEEDPSPATDVQDVDGSDPETRSEPGESSGRSDQADQQPSDPIDPTVQAAITEDTESLDGSGSGDLDATGTGDASASTEPTNDSPGDPETVPADKEQAQPGRDDVTKEQVA